MVKRFGIKKVIITLLAGVSLVGVGVAAGATSSYAVGQPAVAHAADAYPIVHAKVLVGNKTRDIVFESWGASNITNSKGVITQNLKGFAGAPNISGYTPNRFRVNFIYTAATKKTRLLNKLYYTKTVLPVTYKTQKLSKQVKVTPGHDFYNHVSGSKYATKRTHYGKTYKGKTVTVNMSGVRKGTKTPYYRCVYKGKTIGWIYGGALVNVTTYKTVKKTATGVANPSNNFYKHVTSSVYATKLTHYGKTYKNKKVTINMQGTRQGTKTPYYRCAVNGKNIGWIYGGALSNAR